MRSIWGHGSWRWRLTAMRLRPRDYRNCWASKARSASSIARSPIASRRARWICKRPGYQIICGRPRWTSSRSISRIMRRTGGSLMGSAERSAHLRRHSGMVPTGRRFAPPDDRLRTRPGISRFRVRRRATPRNDEEDAVRSHENALLPEPLRRAVFGKCLRPLDVILRRRHRLHCGILALFGDRLFQRYRQALLNGLLGGADRHRAVLADRLRPALSACQRCAGWHALIHKTEFVAF